MPLQRTTSHARGLHTYAAAAINKNLDQENAYPTVSNVPSIVQYASQSAALDDQHCLPLRIYGTAFPVIILSSDHTPEGALSEEHLPKFTTTLWTNSKIDRILPLKVKTRILSIVHHVLSQSHHRLANYKLELATKQNNFIFCLQGSQIRYFILFCARGKIIQDALLLPSGVQLPTQNPLTRTALLPEILPIGFEKKIISQTHFTNSQEAIFPVITFKGYGRDLGALLSNFRDTPTITSRLSIPAQIKIKNNLENLLQNLSEEQKIEEYTFQIINQDFAHFTFTVADSPEVYSIEFLCSEDIHSVLSIKTRCFLPEGLHETDLDRYTPVERNTPSPSRSIEIPSDSQSTRHQVKSKEPKKTLNIGVSSSDEEGVTESQFAAFAAVIEAQKETRRQNTRVALAFRRTAAQAARQEKTRVTIRTINPNHAPEELHVENHGAIRIRNRSARAPATAAGGAAAGGAAAGMAAVGIAAEGMAAVGRAAAAWASVYIPPPVERESYYDRAPLGALAIDTEDSELEIVDC